MADIRIVYGMKVLRPEMVCRIMPGPPPTLRENATHYAKRGLIYMSVALLIFGGSLAATKNPEAFFRGFVNGVAGYYIARGAFR